MRQGLVKCKVHRHTREERYDRVFYETAAQPKVKRSDCVSSSGHVIPEGVWFGVPPHRTTPSSQK